MPFSTGTPRPAARRAPPGGSFGRLLARHARALCLNLPAALAGNGEAVHDARVASRRIREAAPLLVAAGVARPKIARRARRVTRSLGPVREIDVALALLDEIEKGEPRASAWIPAVREHLGQVVSSRRAAMIERLAAFDPRSLAARLRGARASLDEPAMSRARAAVALRLRLRAAAVTAAVDAAGTLYTPDGLHAVRVRVKKLRYTLELARAFATRGLHAPPLAPLKDAQDLLGRLHDLDVLMAEIRKVGHGAGTGETPLSRTGETPVLLGDVVEREAHQLHAGYLKSRQGILDLAAGCRRFALALGPARRPAKARALEEEHGRRHQPIPRAARDRGGARRGVA